MINIMICDDDIKSINTTKQLLSKILIESSFGDLLINIECSCSATETLERATNFQPDILILDIHMPEKNGFEIAEEFHKNNPTTKIIFLSNYEQFVFYSLRFSPFRFIRKSMINEELPEAVHSAIIALTNQTKSLTIKNVSDYDVVPINTILYIEKIKYKNYLTIISTTGTIEYRETIQTLEKMLAGSGFFRINSGTLINMKYIKQISYQNVVLRNGQILPVAISKLNKLKKDFSTYQRLDYLL